MVYFLNPNFEGNSCKLLDLNKQEITGRIKSGRDDQHLIIEVNGYSREIGTDTLQNARINGKYIVLATDRKISSIKSIDDYIYHSNRRAGIPNQKELVENNININDIIITTSKLRNTVFDSRVFNPIKLGSYLDTFISRKGGILPGSNIMVSGDPGIGKSSLLMDVAIAALTEDSTKKCLYISAEMTELDVKEFEQYYPGIIDLDFLYINKYVTDPNLNIRPYIALEAVLNQGWDLVIIDSIAETQSIIQEDLGYSFKKAEKYILDLMIKHNEGNNKLNLFTSFLAIQQRTKGGEYIGSKRLEHMTTAYLDLKKDDKERNKQYLMFHKNRKGVSRVKLYYKLDPVLGIIYDIDRHKTDLDINSRLQTGGNLEIEEIKSDFFENLFRTAEVA